VIGGLVIKFAFIAALSSAFFYFRTHLRPTNWTLRTGRISYIALVALQLTASVLLLYNILTHQFQFSYVWSYSSRNLSLPLLISTFYAGQEGSFMLWTLFTAIIGLFLLRYSSRKNYEPEVMSVYAMILSFLLFMLVVKNPFAYLWDVFPNELLQTGAIPAGITNFVVVDAAKQLWARIPLDGRGLNPLLQNYWMVIHPQILFLGFSAMAIPYTLAVAGLMKRDYRSWIRVAMPWSVFGAMVLGVGIILGGYWAYETLGWGGFWGWDPVENSSLIPWLICVAAIHTALIQRETGAFMRTNFVLSMLTFIMVLYSTFLTRSGILGETSVHSFVDPGMFVYWMLLAFIGVFVVLGFGLLFLRMREMPKVVARHAVMSREFAMFLGASALVFSAIFVVVGTSSPIITSIVKGKASAVDIMYYVRTNLPIGIAITFLSGLGQLLWWRKTGTGSLIRRMAIPSAFGIVLAFAVLLMGREEFLIILFVFISGFSLFANLQAGYAIYRGNPKFGGGALAHIGIAIMCIGFVTSERYDVTKTVALEQGRTTEALGYQLTYTGNRQVDAERYAFDVSVERDGRTLHVALFSITVSSRELFFGIRISSIISTGISTLLHCQWKKPAGERTRRFWILSVDQQKR
jgi:cytochrome c-type biogenesis protein CcmF